MMAFRPILYAAGVLAAMLGAGAAHAVPGWATGWVNLRACPSTQCDKFTAIPQGARVEVYSCNGWCELDYGGYHGYASARYIALGGYTPAPPPIIAPPIPMPPAIYWDYGRPWWDDRNQAWYDGRRWWYDGRWHRSPRDGFYFEFRF